MDEMNTMEMVTENNSGAEVEVPVCEVEPEVNKQANLIGTAIAIVGTIGAYEVVKRVGKKVCRGVKNWFASRKKANAEPEAATDEKSETIEVELVNE